MGRVMIVVSVALILSVRINCLVFERIIEKEWRHIDRDRCRYREWDVGIDIEMLDYISHPFHLCVTHFYDPIALKLILYVVQPVHLSPGPWYPKPLQRGGKLN